MSPEELWATKYAPLFAEEKAKEDARREEAFLDLPVTVCGEPIRVMTPMDLLVMNGIESPFVCYGRAPAAPDIAVFIWWHHEGNDHSEGYRMTWQKARMIRRLSKRYNSEDGDGFEQACDEVRDYIERIFQDAPPGSQDGERRPFGTCFLAPLLMRITSEAGAFDPASGKPFAHSPLTRLFQYLKTMRAKAQGNEFVDHAPSDRLMGLWLAEVNGRMNQPTGSN
jgi:hypothetical protein